MQADAHCNSHAVAASCKLQSSQQCPPINQGYDLPLCLPGAARVEQRMRLLQMLFACRCHKPIIAGQHGIFLRQLQTEQMRTFPQGFRVQTLNLATAVRSASRLPTARQSERTKKIHAETEPSGLHAAVVLCKCWIFSVSGRRDHSLRRGQHCLLALSYL